MDGQGWVLEDGKDNYPSTNGTWKLIKNEMPLDDGMIILADHHAIKVNLKNTYC